MELNLKDKVVIITGGATGIGKCTAIEYLKEGAHVAVCARTLKNLENAKAECAELGYELDIYQVDVSDTASLEKLACDVEAKYGGIDIWINNAGTSVRRPALDFTPEEFERIRKVDFDAVFYGSQIAGRHMIAKGRKGCIVNVSSYTAIMGHTELAVYASCKAAVSSLTKTFAANLAPYGIRVVGFLPGMIVTEISKNSIAKNRDLYIQNVALGRLGEVEDLAKPIVFLTSDACGYMTGIDLQITGGKYIVQDPRRAWAIKAEKEAAAASE